MQCLSSPARRGFSLLELSIVLIIIGLLAGAVMGSAHLVHGARLKNTFSSAQEIMRAVRHFNDQYHYLPGDMPNATDVWGAADGSTGNTTGCRTTVSTDKRTCNGDNDGRIEITATASYEKLRAWQHLANAEFLDGHYTGTYDGGELKGNVNSPTTSLKGGVYEMHYQDTAIFGRVGHFVKIAKPVSGGANGALLSPADAATIDRKFDDGLADGGEMVAIDALDVGNCVTNGTSLSAPSDYIVTNDNPGCRIYMWMH